MERELPLNGAVDATIICLVTLGETSMWRLICALSAAASLATPVDVLAAGAPVRKPPVDVTALTAPATTVPPASSNPSVVQGATREQVFGGCGGRRIRDPQTNQCRGPADVGH